MSNRKSYLGKLYDTVQQEVDENAWVTELVDNIKTDEVMRGQQHTYHCEDDYNAYEGEW